MWYKISNGYMWVRGPKLPAEYQEVEYIQSSWTQYIDTWIMWENKYRINTKFTFTDLWWTSEDLCVIASSWTSRPSYMSYIKKRGNYWHYWSQMVWSDYQTATWSNPSIAANTEYTVEAKLSTSWNYLTVNWTRNTWSYSSAYNTWYSMYMFASNNGWTVWNQMKWKIFYLKMYDLSDNLIRDFVPCYRKLDNVIWMYDMVEWKFYANSWTGAFSKGNDVAPTYVFKEKQFYPWTRWWLPNANTLLYLPLESDIVDKSWKSWRTFTTNWLTYTTVWWVQSVHIWSTGWIKLTTPYPLVPKTDTYPCTVSVFVYITNTSTNRSILDMAATNWNRQGLGFDTSNKLYMSVYNDINDSNYVKLETTLVPSQWNNIIYTITKTSSKLYVNWVLVASWVGNTNYPRWNWPYSHDNTQWIFCVRDVNNYGRWLDWNARELIMEKVEWSAQEVADYYTTIKDKLWF